MFSLKKKKSKTNQHGGSTAATIDIHYDCHFCQKRTSFQIMVTRALYVKYAASQNYYYQKDINLILQGTRSRANTLFKEWSIDGEYYKRFYAYHEWKSKCQMLTEYYKYHKDIPRNFMQPVTKILAKYHDKRRRIDYIRITKMLGAQPEQTNKSQHSIRQSLQNILDQLNFTDQQKSNVSNTLLDIQKNLKEIINTSKNADLFDEEKYNLPLQIKFVDHNKIVEHNFRKKQILAPQTARETSQGKQQKYSSERQQTPLTYRKGGLKKSISPKPKMVQKQPSQKLLVKTNKPFPSNNLILQCLIKKLQNQQSQQSSNFKKKVVAKCDSQDLFNKRKRRVMSSNHEAGGQSSVRLDLTQLKHTNSKSKIQLTFRDKSRNGRQSVQA
ncbi:hypothetical protein pb186bvf_018059 [Paramecium bursaria]